MMNKKTSSAKPRPSRSYSETDQSKAGSANRVAESVAAYRSAVSRAYYAVFHCGAEFLSGLGIQTSRGPQTHGQLQARVNNCGVTEFQQLYRIIYRLDDNRLLADYDLKSKEFQSQATTALLVVSAKQAIAIIKDCRKSQSLCNQIRQGVREYEAKIKA